MIETKQNKDFAIQNMGEQGYHFVSIAYSRRKTRFGSKKHATDRKDAIKLTISFVKDGSNWQNFYCILRVVILM